MVLTKSFTEALIHLCTHVFILTTSMHLKWLMHWNWLQWRIYYCAYDDSYTCKNALFHAFVLAHTLIVSCKFIYHMNILYFKKCLKDTYWQWFLRCSRSIEWGLRYLLTEVEGWLSKVGPWCLRRYWHGAAFLKENLDSWHHAL